MPFILSSILLRQGLDLRERSFSHVILSELIGLLFASCQEMGVVSISRLSPGEKCFEAVAFSEHFYLYGNVEDL